MTRAVFYVTIFFLSSNVTKAYHPCRRVLAPVVVSVCLVGKMRYEVSGLGLDRSRHVAAGQRVVKSRKTPDRVQLGSCLGVVAHHRADGVNRAPRLGHPTTSNCRLQLRRETLNSTCFLSGGLSLGVIRARGPHNASSCSSNV